MRLRCASPRSTAARQATNCALVLRSSRMDFLQHFLLGQPVEDNGQDSGGLMFTTRGIALAGGELIAGIDAELANSSLLQYQSGPTTDGPPAANAIRPAGRQYDYAVDSGVLAGYANWRRPLGAQLSLEAGLRLEHARYDYDNRMIDGNTDENGIPCPGGCLYSRPADRSDDFTNLAPRVSLLWSASASITRLPLARTRLPRAGGDRALSPAAAADGRRPRLRDDRRGRTWPALARRDGVPRPRAVPHGQGRRDPARFGRIQREWRPNAASGHRVRRRLGIRGGLVAVGGGHLRAARVPLHRARRTGRADHFGQRHGHGAARPPCAAVAVRRPDWRPSWNGSWVGAYWANAANTARYGGHDVGNLRLAVEAAQDWTATLRVINLLDTAYADRADFAFGEFRYFPGRGRAYFLELGWRKD